MSWTLLLALTLTLSIALFATWSRRAELARMRRVVDERERVTSQGANEAKLQHPLIDLSRCLGCGTCVAVCPEDNVLGLVHGQAVLVNPARCQGISACERECPVGAITVTIANIEERDDIPALEGLEAVGSPGLYLAGEVTAHALIKVAIEHGTAVARAAAARCESRQLSTSTAAAPALAGAPAAHREAQQTSAHAQQQHQRAAAVASSTTSEIPLGIGGARLGSDGSPTATPLDLCIVGAGPAGLACALEAKRLNMNFVVLEQEPNLGGTVATYPRHKLVLTQPVELPLYGKIKRTEFEKEELIELWQQVAYEHALPIEHGQVFEGVDEGKDGYTVRTKERSYVANNVCLAIGRRGVPRKLEVPGESLPKVAYSLLDARAYAGRRVLVVGGGDSAIEAALGLAEQDGTQVTLSYRKQSFFRLRSRNAERIDAAIADGRLDVVFASEVESIHEDHVRLVVEVDRQLQVREIPNDDVFVMAGGVLPKELLQNSGVSFDNALQAPANLGVERGTGLLPALAAALTVTLAALVWVLWHSDYYLLPLDERATHDKHEWLRPGRSLGLWLGIVSTALIVINLLYLARRSPRFKWVRGSLQLWMSSHVATGVLALLATMLHAGMAPGDTPGGHAFWALALLLVTGAIGRYLYAWVPRAANGRELALDEVRAELSDALDALDDEHGFGQRARSDVEELIRAKQWKTSFVARVLALLGVRRDLTRCVRKIAEDARAHGVPPHELQATLALVRSAYHSAVGVAHYEDLRGLLATWRWLHRWGALLMVLLLVAHIVHALTYGSLI